MSKMMRITEETSARLNELARDLRKSKQSILQEAVQNLAEARFFQRVEEEYARLSEKDKKEMQEELKDFDGTLMDGLEDEPYEE